MDNDIKEMCHKCGKYPAEYNQTYCEFCLGISNKDDDIKEILEEIKSYTEHEYLPPCCELAPRDCKILLDCITNLQEKLKVSQTNEETYRLEMQDITKILGLNEHTTFDEVKEYATNLQERNEKAIKLLKEAGCYDEETKTFCDDVWEELPKLLSILQGSDDNGNNR